MKRNILLFCVVFLILLSSCTTNPEAYKSARFYFGLRVDRKIEPVLYEEYWSMTGEGIVNIIYEFDSVSNATFLKKNSFSEFKDLPINIKKPILIDHDCANYILPEVYHQIYFSNDYEFIDHKGKYKITGKTGEHTSSIVLYDEDLMKLFMHYMVDYNGNP